MHRYNLNLMMARSALAERAYADGERAAKLLGHAAAYVRRALALANAMRDRKRAGLCLKILNWLRADLRRLTA